MRLLVAKCDVVVAVHGLAGAREGIDVGGLDEALRDKIAANLKSAGFNTKAVATGDHAAISLNNICNRGRRGLGAQLEITRGLRDKLMRDESLMKTFAEAVRHAIDVHDSECVLDADSNRQTRNAFRLRSAQASPFGLATSFLPLNHHRSKLWLASSRSSPPF